MTEVSAAGPQQRAASPSAAAELDFESYRTELTGHCYRMLGSPFDAEDAVQETFVRAWRAYERFEGRASLRTWLYRIATNVCLDHSQARTRRARPMDVGPSSTVAAAELVERGAEAWIEPIPDGWMLRADDDPATQAVTRETTRLAFVAALQHLPPRQRAVLVLRDVLGLRAAEVAELLDTSVAAVNSALQRARAALAAREPVATDALEPDDPRQRQRLAAFVDAFERYDMNALAALLREDAIQSMPPYDLWLHGRDEVCAWMLGPGAGCRGSRLLATAGGNGLPAYGQYRRAPDGDGYRPWALQVVELVNGDIVGLTAFLDTARLFPLFGLPDRLDASGAPPTSDTTPIG